jgi:uncharacterized membrane protein
VFEFLFKYPASVYARSELIFIRELPLLPIIAVLMLMAVGIAWLLGRRYRRATWSRRVVVFVLQLAMVVVALALLAQPALQSQRLRAGENTVALVLDASASMAQGVGSTRFAEAQDHLAFAATAADEQNLNLRRFLLRDTAVSVDEFVTHEASGAASAIGDSLIKVLEEGRGRSLAAVVLASDGSDTEGGLSSERLAQIAAFGVPVHTVGVGRERMPEDLELGQVFVPESAFPSSTIAARVNIRHDGGAAARVSVYSGDQLLQSVPITLPPGSTTTTAWVELTLDDPGYHPLRFSVHSEGEEQELRNNRQSALVKVEAKQFRVLYYEGEPRWEYKFLRRAVENQRELSLATLLKVSPNKFYRQGIETPEQLANGFPETRAELFGFDAVIIGSVAAASFSEDQLENIRAFVSERGGSLLMLAGRSGLGNGGWGQSAIADLLPTALPPSADESFVREKVKVRLTPDGSNNRALRLEDSEADNTLAWETLPQVADYQRLGRLKPAARAWVEGDNGAEVLPLLVAQRFGRGHSYIMATGGTWRWQMSLPVEDDRHERFWQQFLRALVSTAPARTSLKAKPDGGGLLALRAEFRDAAFEPMDDLEVTAVVSHEDGDSWTVDLDGGGQNPGVYTATITPNATGSWYFEAIAQRDGNTLDVLRASTYAQSDDKEHFNLRRNSALLRRLADASGGRYLEVTDLDALPDLLRYESAGVTEAVIRPVWDAPALFLLLLILKTAEWLLRRRWSSI